MKVPLFINDLKTGREVEVYIVGQRLAIEIPAGFNLPKPFKKSMLSLHPTVEQWKLISEAAASRG